MTREALEAGAAAYIQVSAEIFLSEANKYLQFNVNEGVIEQVKRAVPSKKSAVCAFYPHTRERLSKDEMVFLHGLWPAHVGIRGRAMIEKHEQFLVSHPQLVDAMLNDAIAPEAKVSSMAKLYLRKLLSRNSPSVPLSTSPPSAPQSASFPPAPPSEG